jgi:YidC/Oxa1 family membrane protein insertase
MDKGKLLNIVLLSMIMTLALQFFLPKNTQPGAISQNVYLQAKKESITIPNIPIIELVNKSTGSISIQPCQDIKLTVNSIPLTGIQENMPKFCHPITVISGSSAILPLKELYTVFSSTAWQYMLTLSWGIGERTVAFEMESPSSIRKVLSTIVYQPIYNGFVGLITFLPWHNLWWAIIIITIIIRLLLLVPQNHMLQSQKKLQILQPKIKKLQEEYKWDQATLGMKMLELYKKEWVNPMSSIVPLLIQMPILIWLYWVITQINDPSNFYHLYSFFKDFNPIEISTYFYGVHLDGVGGIIGWVMAILLGTIQWIQAKLSVNYQSKKEEKKEMIIIEKKDDVPEFALDPEIMQKMMLYFFPLMIAGTSYFFPHGVWLYWFIGTLFVIAQQFYVNRKK